MSRNTKQKELINHEINKSTTFFSADDIYGRAKKKDSTIGIATVYRFLKELRDKHELHSYLCERKALYSKNKSNHCHFTCERCGTMKHIPLASVDFLKKNISGSICHFQIDINGICENCLKK